MKKKKDEYKKGYIKKVIEEFKKECSKEKILIQDFFLGDSRKGLMLYNKQTFNPEFPLKSRLFKKDLPKKIKEIIKLILDDEDFKRIKLI